MFWLTNILKITAEALEGLKTVTNGLILMASMISDDLLSGCGKLMSLHSLTDSNRQSISHLLFFRKSTVTLLMLYNLSPSKRVNLLQILAHGQ
jgi:hypothetical protein